jgi:hypothetical protein
MRRLATAPNESLDVWNMCFNVASRRAAGVAATPANAEVAMPRCLPVVAILLLDLIAAGCAPDATAPIPPRRAVTSLTATAMADANEATALAISDTTSGGMCRTAPSSIPYLPTRYPPRPGT